MEPRPLEELLRPTAVLDELRRTDFARLDRGGHVYLDFTGGGLAADRLVEGHLAILRDHVLGNPHSDNPTSRPMTALVEAARTAVLAHLGAPPGEYECVFTPNATGAVRLVGESFPFGPDRGYLLSADNHNSVNGVREFARSAGAPVRYVPVTAPELRLDEGRVRSALQAAPAGLFAYPAQSNYSGVQHPWRLAAAARERGWRVLVDVAAYAPTNVIDLARHPADFVCLSFYKMFGYPTGVGALVARRDALAELRRPWFSGGTVAMATVGGDGHRLVAGAEGFEDGTLNYLALPAVTMGLELLAGVGMPVIHERVGTLTTWLMQELGALRHRSGTPMVRVLGPGGTADRGGTVTFNLVDPDGVELHDRAVEAAATAAGISLRTGCFCNPGAGEAAHGLAPEQMRELFADAAVRSFCDVDDRLRERTGAGVSALRVSVGAVTNAADLHRLLAVLGTFRDRPAAEVAAGVGHRPPGPDTP